MSWKYTFAKVGAIARSFSSTRKDDTFIKVGGNGLSTFSTVRNLAFLQTTGIAKGFFSTNLDKFFISTGAVNTTFFSTPDPNSPKLLELKIGDITVNMDYTRLIIEDGTGVYNADTNPGGYNPEGDPPIYNRPARSEVDLWIVYRIPYDRSLPESAQNPSFYYFPSVQYGSMTPFEYPLDITVQGIYEIVMLAVPLGTDYATFNGSTQDVIGYAQAQPDWYYTTMGICIDDVIVNCMNRKRYAFLQGVMCGECDEDYLSLYSDYVGMLNALDLSDFNNAIILYNRIKTKCSEVSCDCGC